MNIRHPDLRRAIDSLNDALLNASQTHGSTTALIDVVATTLPLLRRVKRDLRRADDYCYIQCISGQTHRLSRHLRQARRRLHTIRFAPVRVVSAGLAGHAADVAERLSEEAAALALDVMRVNHEKIAEAA